MRHHYLISYDISDPDRLRRVARVVGDFGERLQLSVFLCLLGRGDLAALRERLRDQINAAADQVLFVRLAALDAADGLDERIEHLGRSHHLPGGDVLIF
jgi:CRISPR-associated protein Cas2